jgi:hypothetical protein
MGELGFLGVSVNQKVGGLGVSYLLSPRVLCVKSFPVVPINRHPGAAPRQHGGVMARMASATFNR